MEKNPLVSPDEALSDVNQQVGLSYVKNRSAMLEERYFNKFISGTKNHGWLVGSKKLFSEIATEFADLENDYMYIKSAAEATSIRYSEFMDCLPTLIEIDLLLKDLEMIQEDDVTYWVQGEKKDRLTALKKLRTAIKIMQG